MFKGYKTYITAGVAVITAIAGYLTGDLGLAEAAQLAFTAIIGATLRRGITSEAAR